MRLKLSIFFAWLAVIVGIVFAIRNADAPPAPAVVIATLTSARPGTLYRPSDYLLWTKANSGQALGDGDFVATGKSGSALLTFDDGRQLAVASDTILIVTKTAASSGAVLTVSLLQGRVLSTKKPSKKTFANVLQIAAGDKTVVFSPNAEGMSVSREENNLTVKSVPGTVSLKTTGRGVTKIKEDVATVGVTDTDQKSWRRLLPPMAFSSRPAPAPVFDAPVPAPATRKPKRGTSMTAPGQTASLAFKPLELAPAPEPEAPSVKTPRLRLLKRHMAFWTLADLATALPKLVVNWPMTVTDAHTSERSTLQMICGNRPASSQALIKGTRFQLNTPGVSLAKAKVKNRADGLTSERTYACFAKVSDRSGQIKAKSEMAQISLRQFFLTGSESVRVHLATMRRSNDRQTVWHRDSGRIQAHDALATLQLSSASLLTPLVPWLNGAAGFSIVPGSTLTGEAYHFMRAGKVIASIVLTEARQDELRALAKDFQADFIYYGRTSDVMPQASTAGRRAWLQTRAAAGQSIYILDRGTFVEVDPKFLLKRDEVQNFVEGTSLDWFTQPVQVIR